MISYDIVDAVFIFINVGVNSPGKQPYRFNLFPESSYCANSRLSSQRKYVVTPFTNFFMRDAGKKVLRLEPKRRYRPRYIPCDMTYSFLQIPPRDGHPCRLANCSPCRASRGLSPPSKCALPGARTKKPRHPRMPRSNTRLKNLIRVLFR